MSDNSIYKGLALVCDGGFARVSYAVGALKALEKLGILPEKMSGASGGAYAVDSFGTDHLDTLDYMFRHVVPTATLSKPHPRWILRKANIPYVDVEKATEIFVQDGMDNAAIRNAKPILINNITDALTGNSHYFTNRQNVNHTRILTASGSMPIATDKYYDMIVDGNHIVATDGGITDPIPYGIPELKDMLKIIIITKSKEQAMEKPDWKQQMFVRMFANSDFPVLKQSLLEKPYKYIEQVRELEQIEKNGEAILLRPKIRLERFNNKAADIEQIINMGFSNTMNDPAVKELAKYAPK